MAEPLLFVRMPSSNSDKASIRCGQQMMGGTPHKEDVEDLQIS